MLERHAAVAQAIVVPAPDDIKGQIPIAFIVPRRGSTPTAAQIEEYALEHGPTYAHPRFVEFMDRLPALSGFERKSTGPRSRRRPLASRAPLAAATSMNPYLDHLIWVCADLEHGARRFEALTGVRPRYGGVHASGMTHNALVGLGSRCYFEILAPVGPAGPADDHWCRLARAAEEPRILTYCLRSPRRCRTRLDLRGVRLAERSGREQRPHHPGRSSLALAVVGTVRRTVRLRLSILHRLARLAAPRGVSWRCAA